MTENESLQHQRDSTPDRSGKRRLGILIGILVCGFVLFFIWIRFRTNDRGGVPERESNAKTESFAIPDQAGFTGTESCRKCHAELTESWLEHPMAHSTLPVAEDDWGDLEMCPSGTVAGAQRVLAAECAEGEMVHHERMYDAEGRPIYDLAYPMDYVVGSGQRGKAYLHRRGDLLFMSPLNWYREAATWDLAPNYEPDDVRRFDRRVTEDCLGCHAGRIAVRERGTNSYLKPTFHETRIGCENCHGPGAEHIAFQEGKSRLDRDPIVNPSDLDHERRESVCYQCHLSASARVLRPGRSQLDFRPGMRLSEIWAVLDRGTDISEDGRTRSVNHVQQMRSSRCFQKSARQMGCISCHDPHRAVAPDEQLTFYRTKCLNCHGQADCRAPQRDRELQQDSCITCHMPSRASNNMNHVAQTDHRILRTTTSEEDPQPAREDHSLQFFADMEAELPPDERKRALVLGTLIDRARTEGRSSHDLTSDLELVLEQFPGDGMVLTALGTLARERNDLASARNYFQRGLDVPSVRENSLFELLQIAYQSREWQSSVDYARQLLEIDAYDPRVYAVLGDSLWNLGQQEAGIAAVKRASELNPGSLPLREWLVERYRRLGQTEELQRERETIERLRSARIPEEIKDISPD